MGLGQSKRRRLRQLSSDALWLMFVGYWMGRLPHDGPYWAGLHVVIVVGLVGAYISTLRREVLER